MTFSYFFRISRLEGFLSSIPGTRNRKTRTQFRSELPTWKGANGMPRKAIGRNSMKVKRKVQGGPGSVRFGYGLGVERFERSRFSVPAAPLQKRFFFFFLCFSTV